MVKIGGEMKILVSGAGGFVGSHLVKYLKRRKHYVVGVDIKKPEFSPSEADEFLNADLRYPNLKIFQGVDEVYHLAADMGGIGYIETHRADITFNNTMIDMLTLKACQEAKVKKFLFTSSACVYPASLQSSNKAVYLREKDAYPADCEDGYGWEKLMMERTCLSFAKDYGMKIYLPRFHNIYGPEGTYDGGKEKSPAALCRKTAKETEEIEIWGDGEQTRSYCYIDDCVEALYLLMQSDYHEPLNIGTDRLVSINQLVDIIEKVAKKKLLRKYNFSAPRGVAGRNADISKAQELLQWNPSTSLEEGIEKTYLWINSQIYQS